MILSPSNRSEKMSLYEGDGDIEQERAEEVGGIKPSGEGPDDWQGSAEELDLSLRRVRRLLAACRKEGASALAHGNRGGKPLLVCCLTIYQIG